jgi:uncharacterized protein YecE (DUF72 family)
MRVLSRPRFIYGTAGWSYADWTGPFYPLGTPDNQFLEFYASRFPGVEIDSTYYRIPSSRMTAAWERNTPENFMFSPKMVDEVTHKRFLKDCDDVVKAYLDAFASLERKLGPIVLQFPYYNKADGITMDSFLERLLPFLDGLQKTHRFAVEIRNKTFLKPALLGALKEHNTALVLIDHVWMPRPHEYQKIDGIFTADYVPIRLLGDRYGIEKITKTWEKVVVDKSERIGEWAQLIQGILDRWECQVFVNNHFQGHAPTTVTDLVARVNTKA